MALDEDQIEYLCLFRSFKNKSVAAAAKSLVNFFRDVCPELLPKKMRGRFTEIDETNEKQNFVFGAQKIDYDIDGIELLKKAEKMDTGKNLGAEEILDDKQLKKIKLLKMKEGVKHVDRHGFRDDDKESKMIAEAQNHSVRLEYYHKMLELLKKKGRAGTFEKDQDDDQDMEDQSGQASEMGEDEISEGNYLGDEEGEHEQFEEFSDAAEEYGESEMSEDEECPELVPAGTRPEKMAKEEAEASSSVSDIDVDEVESSSEYDSDELDRGNTANPHGFVYGNMLETFSKTRRERIDEMRAAKDHEAHRAKFKKKPQSKNIGKSQKMNQKNKPFMMMKQKKIRDQVTRMYDQKINSKKRKVKQLGHFRKAT